MIVKRSVLSVSETHPYPNLALEQLLMRAVEPNEVLLYLWQNQKTVVIGRNQNAWAECRVETLERDGGFLARRSSGGGAVFHDLGNLNFTFAARRTNYDVTRQLSVILTALATFGIRAEQTGRNDISVGGRKVSGNAFTEKGDYCCHHGTLLIASDMARLSHYLTASAKKLTAKGVSSVRSRVANLGEMNPDLTVEALRPVLIEAFGTVYGGMPEPFDMDRLDPAQLAEETARFGSREWLLGKNPPFERSYAERFDWGEIDLRLMLKENKVCQVTSYSDALDADWIEYLPRALEGCIYTSAALSDALRAVPCTTALRRQMADDMCALVTARSAKEEDKS